MRRGFVVVAPVAAQVDQADQAPALQLAQAVADVGARDLQVLDDLVGMHRSPGDVEQGMNLRHGTVDAPAGPHLAPVQNESRNGRSKGHDGSLLSSSISVKTEMDEGQ